ncbi:MAG: hypothetical protein ACLQPD_33005 [Desulfomonilaceae bacterium]
MITLPEPLPCRENGNFNEFLPTAPAARRKIIQVVDPKTAEGQKRLLEARVSATPKSVYVRAILLHCRECFGVIPVRTDCGGQTLHKDGFEKSDSPGMFILRRRIRQLWKVQAGRPGLPGSNDADGNQP